METSQIILIVFIALLLIAYPIMMMTKNKKDRQRMAEQTNSLKRGDKVLTTSGVYGTIVDLHLEGDTKIVTIETGTDKNKGYISVDAYSIYTIIPDENEPAKEEKPAEEIPADPQTTQENPKQEKSEFDKLLKKENTEKKKTTRKKKAE